jgi:calcineurin-like phosphoesterase family protein
VFGGIDAEGRVVAEGIVVAALQPPCAVIAYGDLTFGATADADVVLKTLPGKKVFVLGNHDLHLLAVAYNIERLKKADTLREIIEAPDCDQLIDWLRQQKLMHYDPVRDVAMVHAGLPPQWSIRKALKHFAE